METEGPDLTDGEALSEEKEEALLSGTTENDERISVDSTKTLAAIMSTMNDNMNSILKRLSVVEAERAPPRKKRRLAAAEPSESGASEDGEISECSDSENLVKENNGETPGLNKGQDGQANTLVPGENLLSEIAQDYDTEATTSPSVSQKLAEIVNKRWMTKLEENKLKTKMEKYNRPENCEKLTVPRVNPEIWAKLNHTSHGSDLRMANLQKTLVRVGSALTQSTDVLLSQLGKYSSSDTELSNKLGELVTYTDSLALLGHLNVELSLRRRELVKPHLNKEYSSLCSSLTPITGLLFGDDLQTQLNNIKASNKIGQATTSGARNTTPKRQNDYKQKSFPHDSKPSFLWQRRGKKNYRPKSNLQWSNKQNFQDKTKTLK